MVEIGWKSVGLLEVAALATLDRDKWVAAVEAADVLLANGGDALYLAHHMRESGLAEILPTLDTVWAGFSAGSMVMAPRIGNDFKPEEYKDNKVQVKGVLIRQSNVDDRISLTSIATLAPTCAK